MPESSQVEPRDPSLSGSRFLLRAVRSFKTYCANFARSSLDGGGIRVNILLSPSKSILADIRTQAQEREGARSSQYCRQWSPRAYRAARCSRSLQAGMKSWGSTTLTLSALVQWTVPLASLTPTR